MESLVNYRSIFPVDALNWLSWCIQCSELSDMSAPFIGEKITFKRLFSCQWRKWFTCMKSEAPVYRETSEPGSDVIILIHSFDSYEGKNMWIKSLFLESSRLLWWEQSRYFTWWRHKNDILIYPQVVIYDAITIFPDKLKLKWFFNVSVISDDYQDHVEVDGMSHSGLVSRTVCSWNWTLSPRISGTLKHKYNRMLESLYLMFHVINFSNSCKYLYYVWQKQQKTESCYDEKLVDC